MQHFGFLRITFNVLDGMQPMIQTLVGVIFLVKSVQLFLQFNDLHHFSEKKSKRDRAESADYAKAIIAVV